MGRNQQRMPTADRRDALWHVAKNVVLKRRAQHAEEGRKLNSKKYEERWAARAEQRDKEIDHTIRSYMRESQYLYTLLDNLDSSGERYWALHGSLAEGEKMILFRLLQFLQDFLKEDLPADLTKNLKPPARRTTKPQTKEKPTEET